MIFQSHTHTLATVYVIFFLLFINFFLYFTCIPYVLHYYIIIISLWKLKSYRLIEIVDSLPLLLAFNDTSWSSKFKVIRFLEWYIWNKPPVPFFQLNKIHSWHLDVMTKLLKYSRFFNLYNIEQFARLKGTFTLNKKKTINIFLSIENIMSYCYVKIIFIYKLPFIMRNS